MVLASEIFKIVQLFNQLVIFRTIKEDSLVANLFCVGSKEAPPLGASLNAWFGALLEQYPESSNPWAFYLFELVKINENHFSLACEQNNYKNLSPSIISAVSSDLKILAELLKWEPVLHLPVNLKLEPKMIMDPGFESLIKGDFTSCLNWLSKWYTNRGTGIFSKYTSFTWVSASMGFKPVLTPDPVTFGNIIGYSRQKSVLTRNTEQFLQGFSANNILLYGDYGLGKLSLIKALSNRYAKEGLRLIEVNKENMADLSTIMEILQNRGLKFILYVGDVVVDTTETRDLLKILFKKVFKMKPVNVLIYITMNKMFLVKETFKDSDDDEVLNIDLILDEIPLSDLFGITLTFNSPNQKEYLMIARGLALHKGLDISQDELDAQAIHWASEHKSYSGWTARQFIEQLEGELGFAAKNRLADLEG